jgi:hypothetical protein
MEREDQAKDRQGANRMAPTASLLAMSSSPSLVSIPFSLLLGLKKGTEDAVSLGAPLYSPDDAL